MVYVDGFSSGLYNISTAFRNQRSSDMISYSEIKRNIFKTSKKFLFNSVVHGVVSGPIIIVLRFKVSREDIFRLRSITPTARILHTYHRYEKRIV